MYWKRWIPFLLIFVALGLVACSGSGLGEPVANRSALAAMEPGAVLERVAVQDDDEAVPEACTYGQGYWKNHPSDWDVEQLTLGETNYSQEELLAILNTPPQGDVTYILAHQLIAAQLNLENDAESIEAIAEANEWLATHPLGTNPDVEWEEAVMLAETLDDYNSGLLAAEACDEIDEEDIDDEDEIDDEEEVDDEEEDEEEGDDEECTGADPHPHAADLADRYEVDYEEIMAWFCDGNGFGEIELAFNLADQAELSVEEVMDMREEGLGWGQIRQELDVQPGRGNAKENPGNGGNPPGLNKDNDDADAQLEGDGGNPPGLDRAPGQGNEKDNPGRGNDKDKDKDNPGRGNDKSKDNPGRGNK